MIRNITGGCLLIFALLFTACHRQDAEEAGKQWKEHEVSELAALMRKMQQENLQMKKSILSGNIPRDFSEDFYTIHTAASTPGMKKDTTAFKVLADEYLRNIKAVTSARTSGEAKKAYNNMIMTCASCHQVYCQGPLSVIRKMKISTDEEIHR